MNWIKNILFLVLLCVSNICNGNWVSPYSTEQGIYLNNLRLGDMDSTFPNFKGCVWGDSAFFNYIAGKWYGYDTSHFLIDSLQWKSRDSIIVWEGGVIRGNLRVWFADTSLWCIDKDTLLAQFFNPATDTLTTTERNRGTSIKVKIRPNSVDTAYYAINSGTTTDKDTLKQGTYNTTTALMSITERNRGTAFTLVVRPDSVWTSANSHTLQGKDTLDIQAMLGDSSICSLTTNGRYVVLVQNGIRIDSLIVVYSDTTGFALAGSSTKNADSLNHHYGTYYIDTTGTTQSKSGCFHIGGNGYGGVTTLNQFNVTCNGYTPSAIIEVGTRGVHTSGQADIMIEAPGWGAGQLGLGVTRNYPSASAGYIDGYSNLFLNANSGGNVRIGTWVTPTEKLDIGGNCKGDTAKFNYFTGTVVGSFNCDSVNACLTDTFNQIRSDAGDSSRQTLNDSMSAITGRWQSDISDSIANINYPDTIAYADSCALAYNSRLFQGVASTGYLLSTGDTADGTYLFNQSIGSQFISNGTSTPSLNGLFTSSTNKGSGEAIGIFGVAYDSGAGAKYGGYFRGYGLGYGLYAEGDSFGIRCSTNSPSKNYAGYFDGNVYITGSIQAAGFTGNLTGNASTATSATYSADTASMTLAKVLRQGATAGTSINMNSFDITGIRKVSADSGRFPVNLRIGAGAFIKRFHMIVNAPASTVAQIQNTSRTGYSQMYFLNGAEAQGFQVGCASDSSVFFPRCAYLDAIGTTPNLIIAISDVEKFRMRTDGTLMSLPTYSNVVGATTRDLFVDDSGKIGYVSSSKYCKENLKKLDNSSSKIYRLKPYEFNYKSDKSKKPQFGLMAEDADSVLPELVSYELVKVDSVWQSMDGTSGGWKYTFRTDSTKPETVVYSRLIPLLLNESIKQKREIDSLKTVIFEVDKRLKNLEK